MKHEAQLPQGTIRYRDEGTGEPLLFLHGLGVNGDLWRKVVPRLSRDFRCVAPDLPLGSHSSPIAPHADLSLPGLAKLTVDFMDAVDLGAATLVGNDSGGAIAQMVAVDHPDRVTRLVLNSCELYDRFLPPLFKPLQVLGSKVPGAVWLVAQLLRVRALQWALAYGPAVKKGLPDRTTMDSYVRPLRESAGVRRDVRSFLRAVDSRYTMEAAERLESFGKPVLLAWAGDDLLFPLEHPRLLAAALPDARVEVIPDARTFVPEDQPDALANLIRGFVREPAARAAA